MSAQPTINHESSPEPCSPDLVVIEGGLREQRFSQEPRPTGRSLGEIVRDGLVGIGVAGATIIASVVDKHPGIDPIEIQRKKLTASGKNPALDRNKS